MDFLKSIFMPKVPLGVKIISWATAIRWAGWGFVEYLIPIFLFSFVGSYAETGILKSVYGISFLLVVPLVGYIANKVPTKYIILAGLFIYPFISLSYFFAGAFGMVIFVVIARLLNGISFALDSIGRSTYIMKHTKKDRIATTFGFFETLTSFWWILAVLLGLVLVKFFEIHELFLAIIPTTFIAIALIFKIPKDSLDNTDNHWRKYLSLKSYGRLLKEMILWSAKMKKLALISVLSTIIFIVPGFFLPIHIYIKEGSFQKIILLMLIYSIPGLFGSPLGILADKIGKRIIPVSLFMIALLLFGLSLTSIYSVQLLIMFLLSLSGLIMGLSINSEVTQAGDPRRYGSLNSAFSEIEEVASIIGAVAVGFLIDGIGISTTFIILGLVALGLVFLNISKTEKPLVHV